MWEFIFSSHFYASSHPVDGARVTKFSGCLSISLCVRLCVHGQRHSPSGLPLTLVMS